MIEVHEAQHDDIFTQIRIAALGIENNSKFVKTGVKGADRALIKLKEKIVEDPYDKFPLDSLKDLSRCCFIFNNAGDLITF